MGISDTALQWIADGDTLQGQKRLFSGEPAPDDRLTRLNRCLYSGGQRDADLIEEEQERLLQLLPRTSGADQTVLLYNLGCIALYNDDIQDARQRFGEVMKLEPDNRFARHNLAYANELLAEFDQAKSHYSAALAQDPGKVLTRMNLALLRMQLGEVDSGLDDLRDLQKQHPRNMGILLYLCRSLLASGARDDAQAALELLDRRRDWEEFLDLRECRAFALYLLDEHAGAEAAFRDLVAANAGNLFARLGLIKVLAAQGNFEGLRTQLEEYQDLNPPQSVQSILDDVRAL